MGRHSDPDPRWFWQSLATAAAKALIGLLLVGLVLAGVVRWTGGGAGDDRDPSDAASPATVPADVAAAPAVEADAERAPRNEDDEENDPAERNEDGGGDDGSVLATVQVLNGSGDPDLLDEVVRVLEELGCEVVSTGRAARRYDETTVFWSAGHQDDAEDLRRLDARFIAVEPNERLDRTIDLHVVIGADWESGN